MYIIVIGCGTIGFQLAQALLATGHEILAIEQNSQKRDGLVDALGSVVITGDGSEASVLEEAGASRAEVVIATTDQDDDNLVACQLAKHRFHVPKTMARVNEPENAELFRQLGIDVVLNPANMVATRVEEELVGQPLVHLAPLQGSERRLVSIRVPPDSEVVGKPIESVGLPAENLISLLVSAHGEPRLPAPGEVFQGGDQVVVVTTPTTEVTLLEILTQGPE